MSKQLEYAQEARDLLKKGVEKLNRAVRVTLGPGGRNVLIDKKFGAPQSTKDGVTVAKQIDLEDPYENMGAQLVKEVASKTADIAGDGTTTATLLASYIYLEGLKCVKTGVNATFLRKGLEKSCVAVVEYLKKISNKVSSNEDIINIGTISANNNKEVGSLIAEAVAKVGKDGVIVVEDGKTSETVLETTKGMKFDRGFISPYFMTNPEEGEAVLEKPYILIYDKAIATSADMVPLMQMIAQLGDGCPLLVIAEDVVGDALAAMVINKMKGLLSSVAIKAPGFGERREKMLKDIAVITGGTVISETLGFKLDKTFKDGANIDNYLGRARKVVIDRGTTTIIDGSCKKEELAGRIKEVKSAIEKTDSGYDNEKLRERLANLSSGIAVIQVGAITDSELKEKKDLMDDAVHATRAAIEEGVVVGGGVALLKSIKVLDDVQYSNQDEELGRDILKKALQEPLKWIANNAGVEGTVVVNKVLEAPDNFGYNAQTLRYCDDLYKDGIMDPTKVVRIALQNAVSVASLMLTTECIIADIPEKEDTNLGDPGLMR